ncbi:MAG: metallophosphoesterase [Tepidisphaeraceae bacterium]
MNLLSKADTQVVVRWRNAKGGDTRASEPIPLRAEQPATFMLDGLQPGQAYRYLLEDRSAGPKELRADCRLQTQRPAGERFTFTIQGDSHPERPQMFDAGLYARTLQQVDADRPDFHVCMGDDFSLNTLHDITEQSVRSRYELQLPFLGLVGQSAPLFLLNGNHEQASLFNYNQKGIPHDAAVWAQRARNDLFPQPTPDGFYTGNATPLEGIGPMRNYFAWTWGDALFVVLDNYWHSPVCVDTQLREDDQKHRGRNRDWWGITLGEAQYRWFRQTLESSRARFKFVFAHHVLGTGRGGIERAPYFEWGGKSNRGISEFGAQRNGWTLPIHQLMANNGVSLFFQGHDHLYARQELDGVVYQTCPVPADPNYAIYNDDRYLTGVKHPNSGYLRVTVEPHQATVQYVRSYLEADESLNRKHGQITHEYTVQPRHS